MNDVTPTWENGMRARGPGASQLVFRVRYSVQSCSFVDTFGKEEKLKGEDLKEEGGWEGKDETQLGDEAEIDDKEKRSLGQWMNISVCEWPELILRERDE